MKTIKETAKLIYKCIKFALPSIILAYIISTFVIANAYIPTGSMERTIMTGSRVIGNRLEYIFTEPRFGDIVIFKNPDAKTDRDGNIHKYFVKRLIGMPGDVVEIVLAQDGYGFVKVNGEVLDETYINGQMVVVEYKRFEVPEEHYFFLGDNRNYSIDARAWINTYVHRKDLIAKVYFQYFKEWKNFR